MKKILIICLAFISAVTQVKADYNPMVVEGRKWTYLNKKVLDALAYDYVEYTFTDEIHGTTEINGKLYSNVYRYQEDALNTENMQPVAYIREEGRKVYGRLCENYISIHGDFKTNLFLDAYMSSSFDEESLLYDFDNPENNPCFAKGSTVETTQITTEDGITRNVYNGWLIEGLGPDTQFLELLNPEAYATSFYNEPSLAFVSDKDGNIIYKGQAYGKKPYCPLLVNRRKWTYYNETIGHELGLLDSYLYTIELAEGAIINGKGYFGAYLYRDEQPDFKTAQPLALLREEDHKVYVKMSDEYSGLPASEAEEKLLYDFDAPINPEHIWADDQYAKVTEGWIIPEDGVKRRVLNNYGYELVVGIGPNCKYSDLLSPLAITTSGGTVRDFGLAYVSDLYGNIIFKGINYGKKPYTPLVRRAQDEGLKFVYYAEGTRPTAGGTLEEEKYVYNIELKGQTKINGINYTNVYRYSDALASDAVPCAYVLETDMVVYGRRNAAYKPDAAGFDRNIAPQDCGGLTDEDAVLYDFKGARLTPVTEDGEWVESQTTVDGMDCLKWMFRRKGDDKYIRTWIEGIGVDDRFGDLITPDYAPATGFDQTQPELHHVEKADGEIIYKGTAFGKAGIEQVSGDTAKTVAGVRYYNLLGVESAEPFQGVNVVVTTYTDGSRQARKVIR